MATTQEGYITPVDCGSMIDGDRFEQLKALIKDAEDDGASVNKDGGKEFSNPYHPGGAYFRPAVVGPVTSDMEIAQTECELTDDVLQDSYTSSVCTHCTADTV